MLIWISGPTGGGKTSLARCLRNRGYSIVEETLPQDLFRAFSTDPARNCEPLQRHLMIKRLNGWQRVEGDAKIAFDRSIDEDVKVFCEMHRRAGLLTERQFELLTQLGRDIQDQIPQPDLIIFVTSDPDVLLRRVINMNSPPTVVDNLNTQIALYSKWLGTRSEQVLGIDTARLDERTMAKFFREI